MLFFLFQKRAKETGQTSKIGRGSLLNGLNLLNRVGRLRISAECSTHKAA